MAHVRQEIEVGVPAADVWAAIADVGATDRLFPGVLTACRLEDGARIVTFADGFVVRELIVDVDPAQRRLAYASVGGSLSHHHATLHVLDQGDGCRIVWEADFLPASMAPRVAGLMARGAEAMKTALTRPTA
jgi:carbon monoxide dehydrogenase subunit G